MSSLLLMGGASAIASGVFPLPGGSEVTALGTDRTGSFSGTATIDLGPRPDEATGASIQISCQTPGILSLDDGAQIECRDGETSSYILPRTAIDDSLITVTAPSDVRWTVVATFIEATSTEWGVNNNGQSYGVENSRGAPDLVAVTATNGLTGYVLRDDLEEADGTAAARNFKSPADALAWQDENAGVVHRIPVYEPDGSTVIGEFLIQYPPQQ